MQLRRGASRMLYKNISINILKLRCYANILCWSKMLASTLRTTLETWLTSFGRLSLLADAYRLSHTWRWASVPSCCQSLLGCSTGFSSKTARFPLSFFFFTCLLPCCSKLVRNLCCANQTDLQIPQSFSRKNAPLTRTVWTFSKWNICLNRITWKDDVFYSEFLHQRTTSLFFLLKIHLDFLLD